MAKKTPNSRVLDPRIVENFVMVGLLPGEVVYKGKKYDTRTMDSSTANQLVESGASFIRKKKVKK